ncbi:MAG: hypothetical protein ACI8Z9_000779 [Paraglaciecola sp.]|jgi:hypothetical protein
MFSVAQIYSLVNTTLETIIPLQEKGYNSIKHNFNDILAP